MLPNADPILQAIGFFVIVLRTIYGISREGCIFVLGFLSYFAQLCLMRGSPKLSYREQSVLASIPKDPRTIDDSFDIEPETVIYAVCPEPSCHATHPPKFRDKSPIPIYPSKCRHRRGGRRCNTILLRPRAVPSKRGSTTIYTPIKPFVYFSPVEWLGRLLSRPGLEAEMDRSWTDAQSFRKSNPGLMKDIFDGDLLRNFKGPDGKHFSIGNGEGRYTFSLSVDFFNPLGNKQAGKKISIGLITLVCLNLPPHLRYRSENMFLAGIIPGPNEPPATAINHFLRPIVDHFITMWSHGIHYSRTDGHRDGRLVRCAIVCVVCDLPAARKTAGFAAFSHNHFCAICECTLKANGYDDLDPVSWKRRTNRDCRRSAKQYRRAGADRGEKIVEQTGVRWSELLRLPYFDPARSVVIDPMHNLLLGLIHEHFTGVLGLSLPVDKNQNPPVLRLSLSNAWMQLSDNEQKSWRRLIRWLEQPMSQDLNTPEGCDQWLLKLAKQHRASLALLCQELLVAPVPSHPAKVGQATCKDLARGLLEWVCLSSVMLKLFHSLLLR